MAGTDIPPGWYPDPSLTRGLERYYDGISWTHQTRPAQEPPPAATAPNAPIPGASGPVAPPNQRTLPEAAAPSGWAATTPNQPVAPAPDPAPGPAPGPGAPGPVPVPEATAGPPAVFADARTSDATAAFLASLPHPSTRPATAAVDPNSSQALLTDVTVPAPKRATMRAEPGWYPDPARTANLRFFDGRGWTNRTRHPGDERRRHLPMAAVTLQSRLLEVTDTQAVHHRGRGKLRNPVTVIQGAQGLPGMGTLAVRTRAGRVGGMLSMVALICGLGFFTLLGWQHWLGGEYQNRVQSHMRQELSKKMTFDPYGSNPTPITLPTTVSNPPPVTTPPAPKPGKTTPPAPKPGKTTTPTQHPKPTPPAVHTDPWAPQPDINPLPPAGWAPPPNRHARSVKAFHTGQAIGRIVIPRMGVDKVMVAGTGAIELDKGVGVATWGVLPGSPGNATLAGHRIGNGHLFYKIDQLRYGDQIIIEIPGQGRAVYEVRGHMIVKPEDTWVTKQTDGVRLTLTSCDPPGSTGRRYIVQAELVSGDFVDQALNRSAWHMVTR